MQHLPQHKFRQRVKRYKSSNKIRTFICWEQFLLMSFAQFTYRESLLDIETCLRAMKEKLYHIRIRSQVSKSTLADANEKRIVSGFISCAFHAAILFLIHLFFVFSLR